MGQLIPFYHPIKKLPVSTPTPPAVDEPEAEATSAKDILETCLKSAETTDQVLVMTCDKDGIMGFLTNCDDLAETILFIELVKQQALFTRPAPEGRA